MCGRFSLISSLYNVAEVFKTSTQEEVGERYNIAPTQKIHVIFQSLGARKLGLMRWGLVPSWVKEPENFSLIINARSETINIKPSFKGAIRHRRCLIPANGYYEWHRAAKAKTPYYIRPKTGELLALAGLYETYTHQNGSTIDTACLVTTRAEGALAAIHHRMPVLLTLDEAENWLACAPVAPVAADPLQPFYTHRNMDDCLDIIAVSERVNNARHDDPSLLDPTPMMAEKIEQATTQQTGQLILL